MKITVVSSIFILAFFSCYCVDLAAGENGDFTPYETLEFGGEFKVIDTWSVTFYNKSSLPIVPALEGDGVIRKNFTFIEENIPNYIIFNFRLIPIPKIGRIWSGEYFVKEEEIVAIYFLIEKQSVDNNYSEIMLTLYDPNGVPVFVQRLDTKDNLTQLQTPISLNSSGLFKVRIDFLVNESSNKIWAFENVAKWINQDDDEKYLTFGLGNTTNLSFQNYYERAVPIFTLSEIIGLQQMFLAEQQGEHLKDTASSLENVSINIGKSIEDVGFQTWAAWLVAIAAIVGIIATFFAGFFKERKRVNNLFRALFSEILLNLRTVNDFLGKGVKKIKDSDLIGIEENLPFSTNCYINILASGELISKIQNKGLVDKIMSAYKTIQYYNTIGRQWNRIHFQRLKNKLEDLKRQLPKELKFLK